MKINLEKLREYTEKGLVRCQTHPSADLLIWNYTQTCQFKGAWNNVTKMCRGLITDLEGNVVSRPLDKFFNLEELEKTPSGDFVAYDKMDGSLGITYPVNGEYKLATRGSFDSDQAIVGNTLLDRTDFFKEGMTYLFEIIYPENRIVVDYKDEKKLVFLGARDIETGKVYTPDYFPDICGYYESTKTVEDYKKPRDNAEGVVLYYESGLMAKSKYEEYVRLHRLVTGVNARRIWDLLRNDQSVNELLERVPEEFSNWVKKTVADLTNKINEIGYLSEICLKDCEQFETRKEKAELIKKSKYPGVVFAMLDKSDWKKLAWRLIKPAHEIPFKKDIDA